VTSAGVGVIGMGAGLFLACLLLGWWNRSDDWHPGDDGVVGLRRTGKNELADRAEKVLADQRRRAAKVLPGLAAFGLAVAAVGAILIVL
jgi:hypothetical protein